MYSQLNASRPPRRAFLQYSALAIASLLTTVGCRQQTTTAGNAASSPTLKIGLEFVGWFYALAGGEGKRLF